MARGHATFTFDGTVHNMPVPLSVAEAVEMATGIGVFRLFGDILRRDAKLTDVVTVLETVINANSKTRQYTREQIHDMAQRSGMLETYIAAGKIIGALFDTPEGGTKEGAKGTKGKAPTPSH